MSLTRLQALPLDVLPPSSPPATPTGSGSGGLGTAEVIGIVALAAGVIALVTVIALYAIARRRRRPGGRIGGPQWNR